MHYGVISQQRRSIILLQRELVRVRFVGLSGYDNKAEYPFLPAVPTVAAAPCRIAHLR